MDNRIPSEEELAKAKADVYKLPEFIPLPTHPVARRVYLVSKCVGCERDIAPKRYIEESNTVPLCHACQSKRRKKVE